MTPAEIFYCCANKFCVASLAAPCDLVDFCYLCSMKEKDTLQREELHLIDFGDLEDKSKNIIKVIGVGGGGCNAVRNMYQEGIENVSFAVCNTDSQALCGSPVPVKIQLGEGLGAGGDPEMGRSEASKSKDEIKALLSDGTKMVFVTAGMGGGTGTGAAPVVAEVAKSMKMLTIGVVTIPFYFEKKRKIIKALKGVEEMRKHVDAMLIVNNERLCDVYSDSDIAVKDAFKRADDILKNATKSISELITIHGDINLDFRDVEATMREGGGAIMAMGRAEGDRRVENAILNALNSPLLYGSDISTAKRILFNIYTSNKHPLFVSEMNQIDAFMETLDPNIDVIWGVGDDDTLDEAAKVTILATGLDDDATMATSNDNEKNDNQSKNYELIIKKLYRPAGKSTVKKPKPIPIGEQTGKGNEKQTEEENDNNGSGAQSNPAPTTETENPMNTQTTTNGNNKDVPTAEPEGEENALQTTGETDNEGKKKQPESFVSRLKKKMEEIATRMLTEEE